MLRAKTSEEKIVNALKKVQELDENTWVIVETSATLKCNETNFLLFMIGDVFPSVYMMTDVKVPSTKIRLQEAYIGLPDYTRNFFSDKDNFLDLKVRVEYQKSLEILSLSLKDSCKEVLSDKIAEIPDDCMRELCSKVCQEVHDWFDVLIKDGNIESINLETVKENDIVCIKGKNRKVCKLASGDLGVIINGKKVSLKEV